MTRRVLSLVVLSLSLSSSAVVAEPIRQFPVTLDAPVMQVEDTLDPRWRLERGETIPPSWREQHLPVWARHAEVDATPPHDSSPSPAPVPEPASLVLVGSGLAMAARAVRRRVA